jgi:hypothetical protein
MGDEMYAIHRDDDGLWCANGGECCAPGEKDGEDGCKRNDNTTRAKAVDLDKMMIPMVVVWEKCFRVDSVGRCVSE